MWLIIILSALVTGDAIFKTRINADMELSMLQIRHDNYDNEYPESKQEVVLDDFFWTGSGDGPPDYIKQMHTGISKDKKLFVKTETVVATVYTDGNNEIDIPICLDCPPEENFAKFPGWNESSGLTPLNFAATDRRYWLLTVMSGFFTKKDNPILEEKLGRLYRLAFTRQQQQQSRHLGINGDHPVFELTNTHQKILNDSDSMTNKVNKNIEEGFETSITYAENEDYKSYVTELPWEFIQQNGTYEKLKYDMRFIKSQHMQQVPSKQSFFLENVRVVIHNITQITEEDIEKGLHVHHADEDFNSNFENRPIANQTELIYSVFIANRPILANLAAHDMRLISETEAANMIGNEIFMKAEPYLKEPQATPLAPATTSKSDSLLESIKRNPALISVSSCAMLFLLLLLVALFLIGRERKRNHTRETLRPSSHNELSTERQTTLSGECAMSVDKSLNDAGIHNFSFENDAKPEPRIHFPQPPNVSSSSDNTSDSSVYCPINPPPKGVNKFLDGHAPTLFDSNKRSRHHQYDRVAERSEAMYTTVVSERKHDKTRYKKRRYLTGNRVGSVETSPVQSARDGAIESVEEDANLTLNYVNYEHTDAFNPHNHYQRRKLQHKKFSEPKMAAKYDYEQQLKTNEAINKEIIKALQPVDRTSDNGSIGSFLSMSSVKAFPKQTLPEPLNRVLDPVFMTYYDNVDNSTWNKDNQDKSNDMKTIDSLPAPKAPPKHRLRQLSQSDNQDPGVLGPIVWQRHKQNLNESMNTGKLPTEEIDDGNEFNYSPKHNPVTMRSQYAELIEGAVQLFSHNEDLPMPLPSRDFNNSRKPKKLTNRGSSAEVCGNKQTAGTTRPSTAVPEETVNSNHSTLPPSPTSNAWAGSISSQGSNSSFVRPLSAGPFHHPAQLLEAPIMDVIQVERHKLKSHNNSQQ